MPKMVDADDVAQMIHLHKQGWTPPAIAKYMGISPTTVRKWLDLGEWKPSAPRQKKPTNKTNSKRYRIG